MNFYRVFTFTLIFWLIHYKIRFIQCTDTTPGLTGTGQSATSTPTSPTGGSDSTKSETDSKNIDLNLGEHSDTDKYNYYRTGYICSYIAKEGYSFKSVNLQNTGFWCCNSNSSIWKGSDENEQVTEIEYDIANNRVTIKSNDLKTFCKKKSGSCKCAFSWCCFFTFGLSLLCYKETTWEEEEIVSGTANTNTTGTTGTSSTPASGGTNESSVNGKSSTASTNLKGTQASS